MIKPTVGRVVWVRRPFETEDPKQPEAGLITYVHGDRKVNVAGFDHTGNPYRVVNIPLLQDDDAKPEGAFACWMPFQVGQARQQQGETEMRVNPQQPSQPVDPVPPAPKD